MQSANAGQHGELEPVISRTLGEKIRAEGWEPKTALVAVARKDREDNAAYRLVDVPRFEAKKYAEAEVIRTSREGEKRLTVPFLWEEGKWRAGAAFRDGRPWEEPDFP